MHYSQRAYRVSPRASAVTAQSEFRMHGCNDFFFFTLCRDVCRSSAAKLIIAAS